MFPSLKIVLAHLGSSERSHSDAAKSFRRIAEETNSFMDTSVNDNIDSLNLALETFGDHRIMYGTDAPYNLLRFRYYVNPSLCLRLMTDRQYHWTDQKEYQGYCHIAAGALMNHFSATENLLDTLSSEKAIQRVFYDNSAKLFGF